MIRLDFGQMIKNFKSIVIKLVVSFLVLCMSVSVWADNDKPKAVVLAIGVEKYELEHLNKLQYVAEDAIDVVRSLSNIADIDASRSQVVVADRVWKDNDASIPQEVSGIPVENRPEGIGRNDVTDIVESFLESVDRESPSQDQPEELVFIYLGGHGDSISDVGVSFLPTDYQENFTRDYSISSLISEHENGPRLNHTILILNMCKAGDLPGSAANPASKQELRDRIVNLTKGSDRRHFIPASVGYQSTFEWEGHGSLLALSLKEVFTYATKPETSKITLGSLWAELGPKLESVQAQYKEATGLDKLDLTPVNLRDQLKETAIDLVIGRTNELSSSRSRYLGEALLSLAFDSNDSRKKELYRLAARNFGRATELSYSNYSENKVWQARAHAAVDEIPQAIDAIASAKQRVSSSSEVVNFLDSVPMTQTTDSSPAVAFFGVQGFEARFGIREFQEWYDFFEKSEIVKIYEAINFIVPNEYDSDAATQVTDYDEIKQGKQSSYEHISLLGNTKVFQDKVNRLPESVHILLVIYGAASPDGFSTLDPIEVINSTDFGSREVTVVFDVPFGGSHLKRLSEDIKARISVVMSAKQDTGMTFRGKEQGTTSILMETISRGLDSKSYEYFDYLHNTTFEMFSERDNYEIGNFYWKKADGLINHPFENPSDSFSKDLQVELLDVYGFWAPIRSKMSMPLMLDADGLTEIREFAEPLDNSSEKSLSSFLERLDAMEFSELPDLAGLKSLKAGAISELLSDPGGGTVVGSAFGNYQRVVDNLENQVVAGGKNSDLLAHFEKSRQLLTETASNRMEEKVESGAIKPLLIVAADYISPEIPDLGPKCMGASATIDSIGVLTTRGDVEVLDENYWNAVDPQIDPCREGSRFNGIRGSSKEPVLSALNGLKRATNAADLLVIVVTGRGAMLGDEPVIILEEATLSDRKSRFEVDGVSPLIPSRDFFDINGFLTLSEIKSALSERTAVILLDGHFQPVDGDRPNLQSRYVFPSQVKKWYSDISSTRITNEDQKRHLIVWPSPILEGSFGQSVVEQLNVGKSVWSPFLQALLGYQDGLESAATFESWLASSTAQYPLNSLGSSDRIAFAAGAGVRELSTILSGKIRTKMNVAAVLSLIGDTRPNSLVEKVSVAAAFCLANELDPENSGLAEIASTGVVKETIDELKKKLTVKVDDEFLFSYLYWTKTIFDECLNEPEIALELYKDIVEQGSYPVKHAELLFEIAENTANKLVKSKMEELTNVLTSSNEIGKELEELIPKIRELSE